MNETAPTPSVLSPLDWRQALRFAVLAVVAFHIAYTPMAYSGLAMVIVVYVFALIQLARLPSTRQVYYLTLAVGFACFAPQLYFFWGIFGAFAIALWAILALWLVLFVVLTRFALLQLGLRRAAWLIPFFWTGLEFFRSELYYLRFSWLNVGYAFAESPLVLWRFQGVYGIGFVELACGEMGSGRQSGLRAGGAAVEFIGPAGRARGIATGRGAVGISR
jgi:apolipoprotein N-acyltransferase